ncbi:MAG TPA: DUF6152 family protein [Steroidobacteraceae bacterium]|nr:DUF6152 family protein [Steroidobacteraceae bacterium]
MFKPVSTTGWLTSALAVTGLACGSVAWGHHSFAMFDMQKEQSLTGTIKQFQWTNPHTWVWIDVPAGNGAPAKEWGIEGMSPNFLGRRGWTVHTLNPGDRVTIVIHPVKNGRMGGSFVRVTLADGTVMNMMGSSTPPKRSHAAPASRAH